jgi:hypothetical protein
MSINTIKLDGEPIVVFTFGEPFDVVSDVNDLTAEIETLSSIYSEGLTIILEMTGIRVDFSSVVSGLGQLARRRSGSSKNRAVLVSSEGIIARVSDWTSQGQYGQRAIPCFKTLDDALAHARAMAQPE